MNMSKILVSLLAFSVFASTAFASKLVILTDEASGSKAKQIKAVILKTPPFNLLRSSELTVEVQILDPAAKPIECHAKTIKYTDEEIYSLQYWSHEKGIDISPEDLKKYKDGYTIDRLVECDTSAIAALGVQFQADRMLFVHTSVYEGGSGGTIPVILSNSRETIGLHEWLHTFGLADEYAYDKQEAQFFCNKRDWVNVAIFNDTPPYASNEDVRTRHQADIPWLPYLSAKAELITDNRLGSPVFGNLGIFHSNTCKNITPELKSWKPTGHPTIMEDPYTNYIAKPYWPAILSALGVTQPRIDLLMKTTVKPGWLMRIDTGADNPPPKI
jgi:hypothetical protein